MHLWLIYTLVAVILWGAWGLVSKLIVDETSAYTSQILFTVGLVLPAAVALFSANRFAGGDRRRGFLFGVLTGVCGGLGNIAFFMALTHGKTSVVVPIGSLFPLVTVGLALLILKERLSRPQWGGVALALIVLYLLSV